MAGEQFNVSENSFRVKNHVSRTGVVVACVAGVVIGLTVGILIGHFAIEKDADDCPVPDGVYLQGVPETIIQDGDPDISDIIMEMINRENIRENLRNLSAKPHVAGTPMDLEQAELLKNFWLEAGLDSATTTSYDVLLSYPDHDKPNTFYLYDGTGSLLLESPEMEADLNHTEFGDDVLKPFLAYSSTGNNTGRVVYANYGRRQDFNQLVNNGTIVSGNIVLARFGMGGRGGKVRLAEEFGAVGVLLYSDPADYIADDVSLDDVYPKSAWMPSTATQRGSVFGGIGDPLTPGYPALESAFRLTVNETLGDIPRIPALPIGFEFAEKLLRLMDGPVAPDDWHGRLNVTYRLETTVASAMSGRLDVTNYNDVKRSYNAFGVIRGSVEPDRYVMLGNHRDSWVYGAIDPSSGTAVMMELSRVLGHLLQQNTWRPRRTIIFCSWGSEEYALIGSTEWVEENTKVLDYRAVAYINMDIAITGTYALRGLGSPPIYRAMYAASKKVANPNTTDTSRPLVYDDWLVKKPWIDPADMSERDLPIIPSPGGGSDYGTFQMRAGIPCGDFRYDEDFSGNVLFYSLYHTGYETFYAVDQLLDPGFYYHATIGKLSGELLRDLSDSLILPFNISDYGVVLRDYTHNLKSAFSSNMTYYSLNSSALDDAVDQFSVAAAEFHTAADTINKNNPFEIRRINDQMMQIERTFLVPEGLPDRPQYRHILHSTTTRANIYGGPSFAGLTDTLLQLMEDPENGGLTQVLQKHFSVIVYMLQQAAASLKETTSFLRQ